VPAPVESFCNQVPTRSETDVHDEVWEMDAGKTQVSAYAINVPPFVRSASISQTDAAGTNLGSRRSILLEISMSNAIWSGPWQQVGNQVAKEGLL
jgi:hypothetical protein